MKAAVSLANFSPVIHHYLSLPNVHNIPTFACIKCQPYFANFTRSLFLSLALSLFLFLSLSLSLTVPKDNDAGSSSPKAITDHWISYLTLSKISALEFSWLQMLVVFIFLLQYIACHENNKVVMHIDWSSLPLFILY